MAYDRYNPAHVAMYLRSVVLEEETMDTEVKEKKQPWVARCQGGPFNGRDAMIGTEPEGKLIRVWESMLYDGQLMHDEKVDEILDGDAVYEEVQRSRLREDIVRGVPIIRGGIYRYVEPGDTSE